MALSATDASDRVEQLIALTERLTERLGAELVLFEKRKPHETARGTICPETANLANMYRREAAKVKAEPSLIAGAPAPMMKRLRTATEKFDAVLDRHTRVLEAAQDADRRPGPRHRDRNPAHARASNTRQRQRALETSAKRKRVTLNRRA